MLNNFFTQHRKKILLATGLFALLIIVWNVANHFLLTVETNQISSVVIYKNGTEKIAVSKDKKKHTFILTPGTYLVKARKDNESSRIALDAHMLESVNKRVTFSKKQNSYKILTAQANTVIGGDKAIYAYDSKNRVLNKFNSTVEPVNSGPWPLQQVASIDSIDNEFALVTYIKNSEAPSVINLRTGKITVVDVKNGDNYYSTVSNHDGSFWIVYQDNISLYTQPFKKPSKKIVANIDLTNHSLSSSKNIILASAVEYIDESGEREPEDTVVLKINNDQTSYTSVDNLFGAKISPDSKQAIYIDDKGYLSVYNFEKKSSTIIDQLDVSLYSWLDNNSFLYSSGGGIWKYDTQKSTSSLYVASQYPVVSVDSFSSDLLYSTYPDEDGASVYKVVSDKQKVAVLTILNNKLPYYGADYTIDYTFINSTPKIYIKTQAAGDTLSPTKEALFKQNILDAKNSALEKIKKLNLYNKGIPIIFENNQSL